MANNISYYFSQRCNREKLNKGILRAQQRKTKQGEEVKQNDPSTVYRCLVCYLQNKSLPDPRCHADAEGRALSLIW